VSLNLRLFEIARLLVRFDNIASLARSGGFLVAEIQNAMDYLPVLAFVTPRPAQPLWLLP
jgi:hypothetical protein